MSTRNTTARPKAGNPTCQTPPRKKKIAAAAANDIPETMSMRATTTYSGTGRDGDGFSSIYSPEGIIAPTRSSINRAAIRAVMSAKS
jgi:hypothetical protein